MPRTARTSVGEVYCHVLNRVNARQEVFHTEDDYQAFITLIEEGCTRVPTRVLAWCIMPNHFHLVLWPSADGEPGRGIALVAHVSRSPPAPPFPRSIT